MKYIVPAAMVISAGTFVGLVCVGVYYLFKLFVMREIP